jgi:hypothetical protein
MLSLALLAGCGQMPESVPATAPPSAPSIESATPPPGTAEANIVTLGDLVARVNAAWASVSSYRAIFTSEAAAAPVPPATPIATPVGTPVATPIATPLATPIARARETFIFEREVVLPDQQRQEASGIGPNDHEAIATGGKLFVRGPLANQIAPGTAPDLWIEVKPADVPVGSVLSLLLGGLPQPPTAPLASVPERLRSQELRDLGRVEFDGRECQVYGAADTVTATGMRVDYSIAVDERNIPCFIETSAGGVVQGRDEYRDIGASFEIVAPEQATPVSVPAALATPTVRD